jgi:hypothetical protein
MQGDSAMQSMDEQADEQVDTRSDAEEIARRYGARGMLERHDLCSCDECQARVVFLWAIEQAA